MGAGSINCSKWGHCRAGEAGNRVYKRAGRGRDSLLKIPPATLELCPAASNILAESTSHLFTTDG